MSEFHVLSCSLSRFKDTDVALGRQRQESNTSDQQRQSEREREVHTPRSPCETSETDQHGPTGDRDETNEPFKKQTEETSDRQT